MMRSIIPTFISLINKLLFQRLGVSLLMLNSFIVANLSKMKKEHQVLKQVVKSKNRYFSIGIQASLIE